MTTSTWPNVDEKVYLDRVAKGEDQAYQEELAREEWAKKAADEAPPLSQEQIDKVRVLLDVR